MPINKNMLDQLREKLNSFEEKNHVIEVRGTTNACTNCFSDGGCYGTCRGTCGGGCSAY